MASTSRKPRPTRAGHGDDVDAALNLWVVINRAHAAITAHAQRDIAQHGLSEAEFGVLELLFHKGPLLLGDIQRRVLVSSGGITFLVDKLTAKGLVERRECPGDRRARFAALTKEGERLLTRVFPAHAECMAKVLGGLTREEQEQATDLLRRLGTSAAAAGPEAPAGRRAGGEENK